MHLNTGKQSWKAVKAVPVITSHFDKSEHLLQSGHKTSDEEVNAEEIHEENIQDLLTCSTSPEEGSKELWSSQQFCGESYCMLKGVYSGSLTLKGDIIWLFLLII